MKTVIFFLIPSQFVMQEVHIKLSPHYSGQKLISEYFQSIQLFSTQVQTKFSLSILTLLGLVWKILSFS